MKTERENRNRKRVTVTVTVTAKSIWLLFTKYLYSTKQVIM